MVMCNPALLAHSAGSLGDMAHAPSIHAKLRERLAGLGVTLSIS